MKNYNPTPPQQRRQQGQSVEQLTRRYLESQGLDFKEANYQCKTGELDLIMTDGEILVFVEVRYRKNPEFCNPLETITRAKQRKIIRTASHYLLTRFKSHNIACRFDVVGVSEQSPGKLDFDWIPQAFY